MMGISPPGFSAVPTYYRCSPRVGATTSRSDCCSRRTFPSWLYEVDQGATTTWERWNGDHGNPEMNSYSHYAFGAVGEWLYRYLGGIDQSPDATGFDKIIIRPQMGRIAGLGSSGLPVGARRHYERLAAAAAMVRCW